MSRFFVTQAAVKGNFIEITDRDDIKHISKVLRLSVGSLIDVSDSKAYEYQLELTEVSKDIVVGRILDKQSFSKEPGIQVSLYQGIPKQGKMETIIQKNVELGIHRIIPVFTERTIVTDSKGNFSNKIERWQKISAEAVKQCKRGIVPEICQAQTFSQMLCDLFDENDLVLFLYENEQGTTIKQVLRSFAAEWLLINAADLVCEESTPKRRPSVALIVGPEGGFSEEEAARLKKSTAKCATLGKTILRTETAGMAALAMVMYELEL